LTKSYIYTDKSRILAQRNGGQAAAEYFYVTDRLGSVRQVIDANCSVVRNYTYSPFGQLLEQGQTQGSPANIRERPATKTWQQATNSPSSHPEINHIHKNLYIKKYINEALY